MYRYIAQKRDGDLQAKSPPGRPALLDSKRQEQLLLHLESTFDLRLEEHAELYAKDQGVKLSASTIDNYFKRLGVRRTKVSQGQ